MTRYQERCVGRLAVRWAPLAAFLALTTLAAADNKADHAKSSPPKPNTPAAAAAENKTPPAAPPTKLGLVTNDPGAFAGYNLMSPLNSTRTYLFDLQGHVAKVWQSDCSPALCPYLLDNGNILRGGSIGIEAQVFGPGPGVGGRVQQFTWDGDLVWDFHFYNAKQLPHHDLTPLPNGNVLMIVWDRITADEALAAGRRPELTGDSHLLVDSLLEVKPAGKTSGEVVWEWHLWDHLVQDFDNSKPNYGNVAEHPELVNLNYGEDALAPAAADKDAANKLKSVGYIGAAGPPGRAKANPDWTHSNGVAYNPKLDQVMISVHNFSEFWIVDHSTTTAEAAGHAGGRSGKGGDLLYRWGNPRVYHAGKKEDQRLFAQHNAHWIADGLPGAGHVLVFNNGSSRPDGNYSSVDEIVLPVDAEGRYSHQPGAAYGPTEATWSYTAPKKTDFYSFFISGAQRLPNGNTLICSGANGTIFEVTPDKTVVWKYVNPLKGGLGSPGGFAALPRPGQLMTPIVRTFLAVSPEQSKRLDEAQQEIDRQLGDLLTPEQKQQLAEPQSPGKPSAPPPAPGAAPPPGASPFAPSFQVGQLLSAGDQQRLKLSDEQKKRLSELQKMVDGQLDKILSESQRKQSKSGFAFGGPPPGGGPSRVPGGGPPDRPGLILPAFAREALKLTDEQKTRLDTFQSQTDEKFSKLLTDEQRKPLKEAQGAASVAPAGQLLSFTMQARLKLSGDQKKQLQSLQKGVDAKLTELLNDEQKKQLKELAAKPPRAGAFANKPADTGPAAPGGPPAGPGGPPGSPSPFAPGSVMPVFRAYRFPATHPGLADKKLLPGETIEQMETPNRSAAFPILDIRRAAGEQVLLD